MQNALAIAHIEQAIDIRRAIVRLNPSHQISERLAVLDDELEMALAALLPPPQIRPLTSVKQNTSVCQSVYCFGMH